MRSAKTVCADGQTDLSIWNRKTSGWLLRFAAALLSLDSGAVSR
jgi:hypothetical protein